MTHASRRLRAAICCPLFALVVLIQFPTVAAGEIFGTKRGKVYHTRSEDCASARKIGGDNKVVFASEQEAQNAGRRLCKRCESLDKKGAAGQSSNDKGSQKASSKNDRNGGAGGEAGASRPSGSDDPANHESIPLPELVAVTKVLPGGTLELDNGEHAVLVGVACPGLRQSGAADATRFLTEQTRGRMIRLTYDGSPCLGLRRDALGRLIVYAVPEPDGRDLGGELIFQGYAWVDRSVSNSRQAEYLRNEEEAWRAGRGVWRRGDEKEGRETVVTGRHALCYHAPKCKHVPLLVGTMSLTLDEAKARRLVPCSDYR